MPYNDPVLTVDLLSSKRKELHNLTKDIINKPKPLPKKEEKKEETKEEKKGEEQAQSDSKTEDNSESDPKSDQSKQIVRISYRQEEVDYIFQN